MAVGGHSAGGHLGHLLNLRWTAFSAGPCGAAGCAPPAGAIGFEGIYDVYAWDAYDRARWGASFACATRAAVGAPPTAKARVRGPGDEGAVLGRGSPRVLAQNAAKLGVSAVGNALVIHSPGDDWVDVGETTAFGKAFAAAFPGKAIVVETGGKCATGEALTTCSREASLAKGHIVRFVGSGGTSL